MEIRRTNTLRLTLALAVMLAGSLPALAAEATDKSMPPGMDEEMMAKMVEFTTPNENHKVLDYFVGNWDFTSSMWMMPASPPETSAGTSESRWIMNGRFLEQTFNGTMMDQPFVGRLTLGFDNIKKEYVSTWVDNMSTAIMTSEATYDADTKTFMENGSHSCPIDGVRHFRAVTKIIDDNTYTYETYVQNKDGSEFKSMEIVYKRR